VGVTVGVSVGHGQQSPVARKAALQPVSTIASSTRIISFVFISQSPPF
jgi:hypothetical protein